MRTSVIGLLLFAVLGVACGGGNDPAGSATGTDSGASTVGTMSAESPGTQGAPDATEPPAEDAESVAAPTPRLDGPSAPDFTLPLAGGGEFTLSAAAKPVYMVFWAEW